MADELRRSHGKRVQEIKNRENGKGLSNLSSEREWRHGDRRWAARHERTFRSHAGIVETHRGAGGVAIGG